jgi:hypothetical protein
MRAATIFLIWIATASSLFGQNQNTVERVEGLSTINIGTENVNKKFTPASVNPKQLKSANTENNNINVTYINFPEQAKVAFEYAISIWEQKITTSIPVTIVAKWESLGGNILAQSKPASFYKNFKTAPVANAYYPIALVEKLSNKEWNETNEADITCSFGQNVSWYFGRDGNTPVSSYDFVTVVLHEMAHGLGISGFFSSENGMGQISNAGNTPSIFDYYIYNSNQERISNTSIFNSPSNQLHKQLTSSQLTHGCVNDNCDHESSTIYAPSTWRDGVSIYHLKDSKELMNPFLSKGEANHNIGTSTLNVLAEMGWDASFFQIQELKDVEETATTLPIQTKINTDLALNNSSVQVIFSTNNFTTKDSVLLSFNPNDQLFEGNLQVNGHKGNVSYYFNAKTTSNETVTYPRQAPNNILKFKIGPDYYSPQLSHNPTKEISNAVINFYATASDNVGVKSVTIEYQINGVAQESFQLNNDGTDNYFGNLELPLQVNKNDKIEYLIIAEDNSARGNKKHLPALGFYRVEVTGENAITTANDEVFAEAAVKMYPNPCTNNLIIDCNAMANANSVEITITDFFGRTVHSETNFDVQFNSKVNVNLSDVTPGIYLASVSDSNSNSFTQKIIKK